MPCPSPRAQENAYHELDLWAFAGIGLIVSGVAVLNLLSKVSTH